MTYFDTCNVFVLCSMAVLTRHNFETTKILAAAATSPSTSILTCCAIRGSDSGLFLRL